MRQPGSQMGGQAAILVHRTRVQPELAFLLFAENYVFGGKRVLIHDPFFGNCKSSSRAAVWRHFTTREGPKCSSAGCVGFRGCLQTTPVYSVRRWWSSPRTLGIGKDQTRKGCCLRRHAIEPHQSGS